MQKVTLSWDRSLFTITMIGVGGMIGAGIFVLTGIATGVAGPAPVLVFLLIGSSMPLFRRPCRPVQNRREPAGVLHNGAVASNACDLSLVQDDHLGHPGRAHSFQGDNGEILQVCRRQLPPGLADLASRQLEPPVAWSAQDVAQGNHPVRAILSADQPIVQLIHSQMLAYQLIQR